MASDAESALSEMMALSNHKFTLDLYKILASKDENTFFSPFSIYVALTLTYFGAKGDTADELAKYLHLPEKREDLLNGIRNLLNELKNPQLNTATEMFLEQTYKVKASYKEVAKKYLDSDSQLMDFKNAAEKAASLINSWVSSQTNQKIQDLIPPGVLTTDTKLVLVNAIHFKDKWLKEFKESSTRVQPFYRSKNEHSDVRMMHLTDHFKYFENESFKVLELPYKNDNLRMVIFLPHEIEGISALEQQMPTISISSILKELKTVKVNVALPKFKLEKFIDLNEALAALGIKTMFDNEKADFSEIHEPTERPLVVSKVLHKAFVEVNEEGTEAAAATAVMMMMYSMPARVVPEISYEFRADHPFIFYILHQDTVLFIGKQVNLK